MADISLDAYINQQQQKRKPQVDMKSMKNRTQIMKGSGNVRIQGPNRALGNARIPGPPRALGPRFNNTAGLAKTKNGFDARQKLSAGKQITNKQVGQVQDARLKLNRQQASDTKQKTVDARQKILEKTKFVDARSKILQAKEKKMDARDKIKARQNVRGVDPQTVKSGTKLTASGMVVKIPALLKSVTQNTTSLSRTVNNNLQTGPAVGFGGGIVTQSGSSLTRVINNTQQRGNFQISTSSVQATPLTLRKTIQLDSQFEDDLGDPDLDMDVEDAPPPLMASNFVITRPVARPSVQGDARMSINNSRYQDQHIVSALSNQQHGLVLNKRVGLSGLSSPNQPSFLARTNIQAGDSLMGEDFQIQRRSGVQPPPVNPPSSINPPLRLYRAPAEDRQTADKSQLTKITRLLNRPAAPPRPEKNTLDDDLSVSGETMSPLQGFRVMISNLHADVTQEDVMELFGSVGPLKKARLIKEGSAEVVFVRSEDSISAVKKYHLRELDGLPMTVKLATSSTNQLSLNTQRKPEPESRKTAADIEASLIHRALFKGMSNREVRPEVPATTFTVRV